MVDHKMTHMGILAGSDARTPENFKRKIFLRETKLYWIDKYGSKYSKAQSGRATGDWPMYRLQLETIIPVEGCS